MKFVVDVVLKEYGQIIIDDAIDTADAFQKAKEIWETEDVPCDDILDVEFRPRRMPDKADFSHLEKIGIAYTDVTDDEIATYKDGDKE